jgi:hypothetical protein
MRCERNTKPGPKTTDVQKTRDRGSRSALPSSIALMNVASMSSADDSEGTSVASLLSCHEKEAETEAVVSMLEKNVSRDLGSEKVITYDVEPGIALEIVLAISSARSVVHDEGTEAKKNEDAGTGLKGAASASRAAARARQNEGSEATNLKTPGELILELW